MVATKGASERVNQVLQIVYLARHGETAWTLSGQHTGLTDLPLTERGERNARRLEERLRGLSFAKVFTSPLQRARRTCELAGFGAVAEIDRDLVEWNYGDYEGRRTAEIQGSALIGKSVPRRLPWRGITSQVGARADARSTAYARSRVMCCFFPAGISCGYWRLAGLGLKAGGLADSSC